MAYTDIDDPTIYFNTKLYTGNGTAIGSGGQSITGVGFAPDWTWIKERSSTSPNKLLDTVRGATKELESNGNNTEATETESLASFDSDGFTVGNNGAVNQSSQTYVSWNWLAGGASPAITYSVKVVSDGGNKYRFDDFGTSAVTLDLQEGGTYTFDGSDSSMASHPIKLSETSNGTHGGGSSYNTGVVYQLDGSTVTESAYVSGYSSASSRKLIITVAASAPTLYYYCHYHSGMGGQANTNSTFGSSNFSGAVQSKVSANTTAGFSIVSFTGTGSATTVGHGLGSKLDWYIVRNRDDVEDWVVYHGANTSAPETDYIVLNLTNATGDSSGVWNDTAPTSSVFSVGTANSTNGSSDQQIAYCFTEKKGYSSFGSYKGNGNADGTFVYTGFLPAWVMVKLTSGSDNWNIVDNKRNTFNEAENTMRANLTNTEYTGTAYGIDLLSNGFKCRTTDGNFNGNGSDYVYFAFAESPFVNSKGVPTNAR